ncbi:MAG: IS1595 family transposase [Candidatus Saccharimonadales bacterium]
MSETINLIDFYNKFADEQTCRNYLEQARWDGEIVCPKCGVIGETYKYSNGKLYKCGACRKQFTVRVGTIFEDSKIPLQKWFLAVYLTTSLKKGVSSIQLSKYLGITQKSAWFMLHRIRYAVEFGSYDKQLGGDVEVDETYIGGRRRGSKRGRGGEHKTPVVGMIEREGDVGTKVTVDTKTSSVSPLVREYVSIDATVHTDEYRVYNDLDRMGYDHQSVNHSVKEWAHNANHTNTIEGFWSHLKRGIDGIQHHVSRKHLQRYCDEYQYRYNTRLMTDFERFENWFGNINKHMTYKELI